MRYLLVLLLMIAVGGDALAQTPPMIAFEPSSGSLPSYTSAAFEGEVTEGGSIDIKIQSVDSTGSNPVAANSGFDVKYKVTRNDSSIESDIWPFGFPANSEQTVKFEAGETETTLTLNIRDDDVFIPDQQVLRYFVKIQENDPSYITYTRPTSIYEVIVTDNDSPPVVGFKTAQSDVMETPLINAPCPDNFRPHENRCALVHIITLTTSRAIAPLEGETSFRVNVDGTAVDPTNGHWPFLERDIPAVFDEGETEATVELTLTDDNLVQSSLEYKLTIQPSASEYGFVLGDNNEHTIMWMDDDAARVPTVSFKDGGSSTVVEGDPVEITLVLDKAHEAGETCPDDDPDDMLDPTEDCLNVSVEIIPENPDGDTRWPFIGTSPQTASFAAGETEAVLVLDTVTDDDSPSPPQAFTLRIVPDPDIEARSRRWNPRINKYELFYEEGYPRQDYQVGTDKERTVNWEDKEAVWLDIAPARGGFSVTPNKAAVSDDSYKIEWKAEETSPATITGESSGELEWDAGGMDTKMVELSYDCSSTGKVEISIESARCSSFEGTDMNAVCFFYHQPGEDLSNVGIDLENVLLRGTGDADETGLAEDLCEMAERQSGSSGGSPGGGTPVSGTPGTPGGGTPGTPGGGTPGTPGGGTPGTPGGGTPGTPGGDDPMDPPDSSDDPMDPEVASDSDGGCSLSGGSGLNQLASNAVAMGLVLMFGLCLVLRGGRRNVSDSLR